MSDSASSSVPAEGGDEQQEEGGSGLGGWFGDIWRGLGRGRNGDNGWRESLEEILEEHDTNEHDGLSLEERRLLTNIIALDGKRVEDAMVPRADIVALDISLPVEEVVDRYMEAPHSRLPVYRDNLDDIAGILHIKDLVKFWGHTGQVDLQSILREPVVVPPSKPVIDLLVEMRANRRHLAIVVDEYGGVDGLVTIEDLIEEVVGDIRDEHDSEADPLFIEQPDGSIDVDARFELEEFESRVGCDLLADKEDEEIDTLGGFVFVALGRVPKRGEVIRHDCGLEFEVVDADPRRIHRLKVHRTARTPETAGSDPPRA
ncbi:hemolysin family protein [Minwuia thermotolerans]|uniref:Magnesium/cobalt efflux protein n=1 Tax=Minwuia thermotolerans TaxID=2056226 RepID=A0A2M9G247_9PROT|nr:hemolysin family protein [Minwuia thermotolerans]PJK29792.1 magnesium/cobalt efflux protein [Minwuia thermotolerans]